MNCSLIIAAVSAETASFSPVPKVLRVPNATAKPSCNGSSLLLMMLSDKLSGDVTALRPDLNAGPAPPVKCTYNLPFQPGPGFLPPADQGLEIGLVGSSMIAIR